MLNRGTANSVKTSVLLSLLLVIAALTVPATRSAAELSTATLTTQYCSDTQVTLQAVVGAPSGVDPGWVGWVIDRTTIGVCEPVVEIRGPSPFPSTPTTFLLSDTLPVASRAYQYRIRAVDASGTRYYLGTHNNFAPAHVHTAYAPCSGATAVRGTLLSGGFGRIVVCTGQCWMSMLLLSSLPPDLAVFIDTPVVVELQGTISDEFEGPYLFGITGYGLPVSCSPVANELFSWGAMKIQYR